MNLVLFDFDKTIVNKDTGAAYIKFMLCRNPLRLLAAIVSLVFTAPFLLHAKTKYVCFSTLLYLATMGMSPRKIICLRKAFIKKYLNDASTTIYQSARIQLASHLQDADKIVVVSGASLWMVKSVFKQSALPNVDFVCSEEKYTCKGLVSKFHCYGSNKVERIQQLYNVEQYDSIVGYSDSAADIPILRLCAKRYIVNPRDRCLTKFSKSFNSGMEVVHWTS